MANVMNLSMTIFILEKIDFKLVFKFEINLQRANDE